jgi:hypothetical protein
MDLMSWMRLYEVNEKEKGFGGRTHLTNCDLTGKDEIKEDQGWVILVWGPGTYGWRSGWKLWGIFKRDFQYQKIFLISLLKVAACKPILSVSDTIISLLITTWKERPLPSCAGGG